MTATDSALLIAAWATGLLGSTHCVGMCGGISAALSFALPEADRRGGRLFAFQLAYNSGRILTYTLLGVVAGALAHGVLGGWAQSPWPRVVAGLFMIALGLYLAGWWLGLQKLERVGGSLWKYLEPLRKVVFPVNRFWKALLAGGLWGFLPCGLVYSALALALARADAVMSGGVMLAFGLGTLPMLLVTGTLAGKMRGLLQKTGTRRTAGVLVILFGAWTALQPLLMKHDGHAGHDAGSHPDHVMPAGNGAMIHEMPGESGAMPGPAAHMTGGVGVAPTATQHAAHMAPALPAADGTPIAPHAGHQGHMMPMPPEASADSGAPQADPMPDMDHRQHPH